MQYIIVAQEHGAAFYYGPFETRQAANTYLDTILSPQLPRGYQLFVRVMTPPADATNTRQAQ